MIFGIYSIRDVKSGFMQPTVEMNDAIAHRNFAHAVQNSDSVLFSHFKDFALYRIGSFDSEHGAVVPYELPTLISEASDCLK